MTTTASAVANMSKEPPRRRASATTDITAATLITPIVSGKPTGPMKRAGSASGQ